MKCACLPRKYKIPFRSFPGWGTWVWLARKKPRSVNLDGRGRIGQTFVLHVFGKSLIKEGGSFNIEDNFVCHSPSKINGFHCFQLRRVGQIRGASSNHLCVRKLLAPYHAPLGRYLLWRWENLKERKVICSQCEGGNVALLHTHFTAHQVYVTKKVSWISPITIFPPSSIHVIPIKVDTKLVLLWPTWNDLQVRSSGWSEVIKSEIRNSTSLLFLKATVNFISNVSQVRWNENMGLTNALHNYRSTGNQLGTDGGASVLTWTSRLEHLHHLFSRFIAANQTGGMMC